MSAAEKRVRKFTRQVALKLDPETMARLDAISAHYARLGIALPRATVLRRAATRGLDVIEAELRIKRPRK